MFICELTWVHINFTEINQNFIRFWTAEFLLWFEIVVHINALLTGTEGQLDTPSYLRQSCEHSAAQNI